MKARPEVFDRVNPKEKCVWQIFKLQYIGKSLF